MGKFVPGSRFYAFTNDEWVILTSISGFTDYLDTDAIQYTINGTSYYLVDMDDLLEDEQDLSDVLDIDLYGYHVAVFTDSVQANIFGPGEL